ncbi:MAG: oxidoreductase [Oligoflexia bacterium]|nr:MAG: oxidoreductase [Oligoflexia bacterium]
MKLRAAVVGVGYLGQFHAQKYKQLSETQFQGQLELVGVCDLNADQAKKVGESLGVQWFTHPKDLIGKVDMVAIASVTLAHYELAKLFLENNIHVNVEKPITEKVSQAQELVKLAKEKNLILCVGHSERFNPAFVEAQRRMTKPLWVENHRHAPFKSRGADVSVIHDLMIHDIDMLLSLDQSPCRVVSAQGGSLITKTYDWASATFEFQSGLKALITTSRVAQQMTRSMKIIEKNQVIEANLQTGDLVVTQIGTAGESLQFTSHQSGKGDNLLIETEAFIKAVLKKAPSVITGQDGLRALEMVEQVIACIKSLS